jgi:medium-chain acyl-[acyl-carrier-protein] hydrolase
MQIREEEFTVKTYDCQPNGEVKISSLMQYLQEIAARHAEQLGFGFRALNQFDSYWILSNIRIEIEKLPAWNDHLAIHTWPSGHSRLIATREFVADNKQGCEILKASSEWMILDKKSSKPKNLTNLHLDLPKDERKVLPQKMKRLEPKNNYSFIERVRVPFSSIDLNGHVNNTEYVKWAIDALRRDFPFNQDIKTIQATYLSEVFEADEIDLFVNASSNELIYVLDRKSDRDINVFLMEISF